MKHNRRHGREKERVSISLLERIQPDAAGIDRGPNSHFVAVPPDRDTRPVREFRTLYRRALPAGRLVCAVWSEGVPMESTGAYWIALYEILEQRDFQVVLVNVHDANNVPGRKSDVQDCEWLRELRSVGLLRSSFRPSAAIVPLRAYLRQRKTLVQETSTRILRMQKALTEMNVMLHVVVTDITAKPDSRACAASWPKSATPSGSGSIATIVATPRTPRSWRP